MPPARPRRHPTPKRIRKSERHSSRPRKGVRRTKGGARESEDRYRVLIETAREMFITADLEGRLASFSPAFRALTGWTEDEWLGRSFTEIVHPQDAPACIAVFEAALRGETGPPLTHRIRARGGEWLTLETTASPHVRDGRVVAVLGVARDITARVRAEEALSQSRRWLQALFENALDPILVIDDGGRYVDANPAAVHLLGYSRDELLSLSTRDVIPAADEERLSESWRVLREQGVYSGEYRLLRKDGGICHAELRSVAGILPGVHFTVARDITERKRMEEEREALLRRVVHLQEEERRAISRELHDEVGQLLTGLRLMIERTDAPDETERRKEAVRLVNELIGRVRDLSMNLRPPMLDELGVLPTLLWHFERFERQTEIAVDLQHTNMDRRFPPAIELTAVRVVQEGLTNAAKHAGVGRVHVTLWSNERTLAARIGDEGRGFDVARALKSQSSGLSGIRERCRLLQGTLKIESTPGAGASLLVELPLGARVEAGTA